MDRPFYRWLGFALWALLIFAFVPFANDLQAWIGRRFGAEALRWGLLAVLALTVAAAGRWLLAARRRDPDRAGSSLWLRFLWIAGIAALVGLWGWRLRVAAEPAHLVSFAVLGVLAFRACHCRLRDHGVYPAAAALVAIVGTLDEVVQWLVPGRFWDLGDVGLNAAIGAVVQVVIWKGVRPASVGPGIQPRSWQITARLLAVEAALLLLCLSNTPARIEGYASRVPGLGYLGRERSTRMTEYGHLLVDPEIGRFKSRLDPPSLEGADRERGAEVARLLRRYRHDWGELDRLHPPWRFPLASEARGHLFHRDRFRAQAREQVDPAERRRLATLAWRENLILERYFPQTLSHSGRALAPAARRQLELEISAPAPQGALQKPEAELASEVSDWLVTAVTEAQGRWGLLAVLAGLAVVDRRASRQPLNPAAS